ncbi:diacylglycerol/lipid kinase family protein [Fulvivirga sedimenti]|uniref:Diacylglycerol kinase family lipid kinase n=1 Tax=Fulvivirga sedimenti TaxID=2879465 RepID=A0A9X1L2V0_9BACT|nr:diacylglycerol kinase family protein [Fulvivirga sedimenti]MCA6078571.1 diacylglycerol kinase family lipid kinase [Fulvivirga sedimenti]
MQPVPLRITVIRNSKHQKKKLLEAWAERNSAAYDIRIVDTRFSGHAIELTKNAIANGTTHLIAAGGDGTLNEVVNGILTSAKPATPLLYYPGGTANDWSKTFTAPASTDEILPRLGGTPRQVFVGKIISGDHGTERFFINIADLGMGADVVRMVNESSKWMGPNITFMKAILQTFLRYRNKMVTIEQDDVTYQQKIRALVIANGKYFGSGMCIAPEADPFSGTFQLVVIGDVSILDYLRYLPRIRKGEHIDHPGVKYYFCRTILVSSKESVGIEADGEFLGMIPARIESGRHWVQML